jgi:ribosomal protein S25
LNIIKQGLKFLKGLIDKEVIKRIRVDVTDPRTINYVKFYKIAIKVIKSYEVLRQLNKEVINIIPVGNEFSNKSI